MVSFFTLDGEVVNYDGNLTIKSLDIDDDSDVFKRYFEHVEKEIGLELYVAALIYTGGKPIWGCASYGEQYDVVMSVEDGVVLSEEERFELLDSFNDANEKELFLMDSFVKKVVIPKIVYMVNGTECDKYQICDVRGLCAEECKVQGFYIW